MRVLPGPVAEGQVLQRALAALVADRAVERVVDEDELERRVLALGRLRRGLRGAGRSSRRPRSACRRPGASASPRPRRGTCGRRRPAGRGAARSRRPGSRSRPSSAASTSPRPFGTCTSRSSIVTVTSSGALTPAPPRPGECVCWSTGAKMPSSDDSPPNGQPPCVDVRAELLARTCRRSSAPGQTAKSPSAQSDLPIDPVADRRAAGRGRRARRRPSSSFSQELHHPARPLAARRALAAGLVHVELRRAQRELHHAAAVVDHDQRGGAEERPDRAERVVVERHVDLPRVSAGTEEPPGMTAFSWRPSGDPARVRVDQLAHRACRARARSCRASRRCRRSRRAPCPASSACRSARTPRRRAR